MAKTKVAKKDFDINNLPKTRKEQFGDLFKHNILLLIEIGLLLLLFTFPLLSSIVIKDVSLIGAYSTEGTTEEIYNIVFTTNFTHNIILIFTLMIAGIGISGVLNIFKRLSYSEPVFFWQDFKKGVKENAKSVVLISLVVGVLSFIANLINMLIGVKVVSIIVYGINYFVVFPIAFISLFLVNSYKNGFAVTLKASATIYIKFFPVIALLYLGIFAPVCIKFISLSYYFVKYIVFIVYIFLFYPTLILGSYMYTLYLFDENINKEQFPDYYKKGLYIKK